MRIWSLCGYDLAMFGHFCTVSSLPTAFPQQSALSSAKNSEQKRTTQSSQLVKCQKLLNCPIHFVQTAYWVSLAFFFPTVTLSIGPLMLLRQVFFFPLLRILCNLFQNSHCSSQVTHFQMQGLFSVESSFKIGNKLRPVHMPQRKITQLVTKSTKTIDKLKSIINFICTAPFIHKIKLKVLSNKS